jgi:indole-3-glycerol phosphate synthase
VNRNARVPASLLDRIVETKVAELAELRRGAVRLRAAAEAAAVPPDFDAALRRGSAVAVIAEVKRRSPSAGAIRSDAGAVKVARMYADAGAAAVSVLTDRQYFGGELSDLERVGAAVDVPLLRKDFTIDVLQLYEARAAGAAAVLLIVRILDDAQLRDFGQLATELGLAALVEVHDDAELDRALGAGARVLGVNNRDLATFVTDLGVTERLASRVPGDIVLVGESGIRTAVDVERLAGAGVDAVLVGEALMRAREPARLLTELSSVQRQPRRQRP